MKKYRFDKAERVNSRIDEYGFLKVKLHVKYDVAQRNMQANHLAYVSKARVEGAQIILDSNYAIQQEIIMAENTNAVENQEHAWVKKISDGFEKLFSLFEK